MLQNKYHIYLFSMENYNCKSQRRLKEFGEELK